MTNSDFIESAEQWLNALPNDVREASFAATALIRLPAQKPPWQSTGIQVLHGQSYSLFAAGRIQWSPRHPTLFGGPRFHLWARVAPGGRIVNLTTETGTFMADVSGEVELGLYMGLWKNDAGELATGTSLYDALQGHIDVLAIAWRGAAKPALSAVASATAPPTFIADELVRIAANIAPPDGWRYLLETGNAEIFTDALDAAGRRTIKLEAQDDQGIVRKPVEFALTPNTQISWRWRMLAQPSARAEDSVHTHDYVSIAAEFDNGRDLTWIWSSALAPGTHFDCPIRAWTARETHWVVRSGTAAIGEWCAEHRNVFVDVSVAMGTPPPRIVAVWLIGVSTFQHGTARTEFADIVLHNASGRLQVL